MKKILSIIAFSLISFVGFSQTKGISYQAVIIDPNPIQIPGTDITAQPYVSKDVWIRFGIYSGTTLQYEEIHKTKTDDYGLVNLVIGAGINTGKAGTFTSLSWDGVTKNILTNVSFDQGGRYAEVSNQKLTYVPYTFLAETAVKLAGVLPIASGGTGATNAIAARTNLGLGNVDNTADADKPVSTATLAILDVKESLANKSINIIADSASSVKYPSVKAIKDYVDARTSSAKNANLAAKATALETPRTINGIPFDGTANIMIPVGVTPPDADATTKGLVKLAGDLSGTADAPAIATGAVTTGKLAAGAVTDAKITSVAGSKVTGNITGNAANVTGTVAIANGGTGASTASGARTNLGLAIGTDVLAQRTFGTAANSAATDFVAVTEKGANNGVATLGVNGKIPSVQIPAISFQNVAVVNSDATMTAISGAQVGSIAIRTDNNNNYVLSALPATTLSNWIALATPLYVSTINGYAGPNVSLTTNDVPEGITNKYYTDAKVRNAITATGPLALNASTGVISMTAASGSSDGYLRSADFTTFNNKQTALTAGVDYATPAGNITGNSANVTGIVAIANGGTGASTAAAALTNLGAEPSSNKSDNILVDGSSTTKFPTFKVIKDYVDQQSANAGVADNSISSAKINGTLAVLKGGTGASNAADARTNLGLVIGTDVMAANFTTTLTGDVTGTGNGSFAATLANSGVTAGTYGSSTAIPTITVDAKGRVTSANTVGIIAGVNSLNYTSTTSYAAGGTINGTSLTLAAADGTNPGLVSTGAQTIAGAKTFNNTTTFNNDISVNGYRIGKGAANVGSNIALGSLALNNASSSGINNVSIGSNTLSSLSTGNNNIAIGANALTNVTTGGNNIAIGKDALTNLPTSGTSNTAIGTLALTLATSSNNTAIGNGAGTRVTSGESNVLVGSNTGIYLTTGSNNVLLGNLAGSGTGTGSVNNVTGTNSVFIGRSAQPQNDGQANQVVIAGYDGTNANTGLGSNTTLIGNTATTQTQIMGALNLPNTTSSTSTTTGGLVVAGGVGIAGAANIGGNVTAPTFIGNVTGTVTGNLSGTANTATNLAGGLSGSIPYQTAAGTTAMLPVGTLNQVLALNGSGLPSWRTIIGFDKEVQKVNFGANTGFGNQANFTTAVGPYSGQQDQGENATALGRNAGNTGQGASAVAVGALAGQTSQGAEAVAVGLRAGETAQGARSVAIGMFAGQTNQHANSIILNATGVALNSDRVNALFIDPIRTATNSNVLVYNPTTKEVTTTTDIAGNAATATLAGNISATTNTSLTSLANLATVGTITSGVWSGTAIDIAKGGTGATTASGALTNLGAAPLASPAFTGTPTAPTPVTSDNSTNIATTEYVKNSISASNAGLSSIGAISATSNAKGATISGTTELILTPADATNGGIVTTSAQTFAGAKTFTNTATFGTDITVNGLTVGKGGGAIQSNTAFGYQSMLSNTVGINNTSFGNSALMANTDGSSNTAIGMYALTANTTGSNNLSIGMGSLAGLSSGSNNTAIGPNAGRTFTGGSSLTTSNNSIYIGSSAMAKVNSSNNQIVIGNQATGKGDNTVTIGNSTNVANYFTGDINLTGNVNGGTWSGTAISIAKGGTGATTAAGALTNLGAEPTVNKSTATDLGNISPSDVLFPSQKAVKSYVDAASAAAGVANGSITNAKLAGSITAANLVGTDITTVGTITSGTWSASVIDIAHGGTGSSTVTGAKTNLGLNNVENTALSTWTGSPYITSVGSLAAAGKTFTFQDLVLGSGTTQGKISTDGGKPIQFFPTYNVESTRMWANGNVTIQTGGTFTDNGYKLEVAGTTNLIGNTTITGTLSTTGTITSGAITYPNTTGTANQVLTTNGSGTASWTTLTLGSTNIDGLSDAKSGGTDFASSIILGHQTTGTLSNATENTAVGLGAMSSITSGDMNVAVGYNALKSVTTGETNNAFGHQALYSTTSGYQNVAVGSTSLYSNTAGYLNTAMGYQSLRLNTTGNSNVGIGSESLLSNVAGSENNAFGARAMYSNTSGGQNVGLGTQSLWLNTTGAGNTSTGYQAAYGNTTSSYNTATGYQALYTNATGSNNTAIGASADVSVDGLTNATAIGYNAVVNASNKIQLGNANVTAVNTSGTITAAGFVGPLTGNASTATTAGNITATANTTLTSLANLATVGTITSGVWSGTAIAIANGGTGSTTKNFVDLTTDQTIAGAKTFSSNISVRGVKIGIGQGDNTTNTVLGGAALGSNTSGTYNTAIGGSALFKNTTGSHNIAAGQGALENSVNGTNNAAMGSNALFNNTSGSGNSGFGIGGLYTNTTGDNNTSIGYGADVASGGLTNATAIGYAAVVGASNRIQLGNSSVTSVVTSGTISATGFTGALTGNASTATKLAATKTINGTAFDGSADITINADAGTLSGTALKSTVTGSSLTGVATITSGTWNGSTIGVAYGGTGATTKAAAFDALSPMTTAGDIIYGGTSGTGTRLAKGTDGQVLGLVSGVPTWSVDAGVTTMTAISATSNANGATISGTALTLTAADATNGGVVTTAAQTFAGAKTFTSVLTVSPIAATASNGSATTISAQSNTNTTTTTYNGGALNLNAGNGGSTGTGGNINLTPGTGGAYGSVNVVGSDLYVYDNNFRVGKGKSSITSNTGVGSQVLNSITTGLANSAFGLSALYSTTTGSSNTAIGSNSLVFNSDGSYNTGVGHSALNQNTSGTNNTSLGYYALRNNTTGTNNVAIGSGSLSSNSSTNSNNVAVGYNALLYGYGNDNTVIGNAAGQNLGYGPVTGGNKNIFVGGNAGNYFGVSSGTNTTGNNSVMIGYDVRPLADGQSNQVVIAGYTGSGAGAVGLGSNTTSLGNTSTQQSRIYGALTVTANAAAANMTGTSSTIAAQNATTATFGGGALNLTAGNAGTTGLGGNIVLTPGTSTTAANNGIIQINGQVQITGGSPGAGEVLTSNATGLATWSYSIGSAVVTSTTSYAITLAESVVFYTGASAGSFTIPAASSTNAGKEITIKNKTAFGITITPASGTIFIDSANTGAASVAVGIEASNNWIKLVSDGTQWNVLRALF